MVKRIISGLVSFQLILGLSLPGVAFGSIETVDVSIDTSKDRASISPYIYGTNADIPGATVTSRRFGGNRQSAYNWENNASNAGSDWIHSSDNFMPDNEGVPKDKSEEPGVAASYFHDKTISKCKDPYSIITLQAAGYVSADKSGTVKEEETAPSARWKKVEFAKNAPFTLTPDTEDDSVYMDEYVNFLVNKYGKSSTATGVKAYSVDNEPALWSGTHKMMHPVPATCDEIISKTTDLSKAVKAVDPGAKIFGAVLYGFYSYYAFQDPSDWVSTYKNQYTWFVDCYLDKMKQESEKAGKRLLDVFDVHWYPETRSGDSKLGVRICDDKDGLNVDVNKVRMQSPRMFWDSTYKDNSWLGEDWLQGRGFFPIIPALKKSIDTYYPGTNLGISEYCFGGGSHVSGGIAQADALGIFGEQGVYSANLWASADTKNYYTAGFNIFTNYDGKGSQYGNTSVKADIDDTINSSVYASVYETDDSKLHIVLVNKDYDNSKTFNVNLTGGKTYTNGKVWGFDRLSSDITQRAPVDVISNNKFTYTLPALSVYHIVLDTNGTAVKLGDVNNDGVVDSGDFTKLRSYLLKASSDINFKAADLNIDGVLDTADYMILRRYLLKKISSLPYFNKGNKEPTADFTMKPLTPFADESITFDASASKDKDGKISSYVWYFGDGTEGIGVSTKHRYSKAGDYEVKLIVTDNTGASTSYSKKITVSLSTGDNTKLNWEDGTTEGFESADGTVENSVEKAFKGSNSLKWTVNGAVDGKLDIKKDCVPSVLPGGRIVFRVFIPADAPISYVQPYIMPHNTTWTDSKWNSTWSGYGSVKQGAWNEFSITLPDTIDPTWNQMIGIQLGTSGEGEFSLYIDSVDWVTEDEISENTDSAKLNWEDGTTGGFEADTGSVLENSSEKAYQGSNSLKWSITGALDGKFSVKKDFVPSVLPGGKITYRVYIPADAPISYIQPFIMPHDASWSESSWNSSWQSYESVTKGAWNEFTITLPDTIDSTWNQQIGIEIGTTGEGEFSLYMDSVDW